MKQTVAVILGILVIGLTPAFAKGLSKNKACAPTSCATIVIPAPLPGAHVFPEYLPERPPIFPDYFDKPHIYPEYMGCVITRPMKPDSSARPVKCPVPFR